MCVEPKTKPHLLKSPVTLGLSTGPLWAERQSAAWAGRFPRGEGRCAQKPRKGEARLDPLSRGILGRRLQGPPPSTWKPSEARLVQQI